MRKIRIITFLLLTTTLSSCSWVSSFYIINNTKGDILITFKLKPTSKNDTNYALRDTIEFYKVIKNKDGNIDGKLSTNSPTSGRFLKKIEKNIEKYSLTIKASTLISSEQNLYNNFSYTDEIKRHEIFENIIEMTIVRMDTKDTISIKKTMLADFTRPFERHDIALIFD